MTSSAPQQAEVHAGAAAPAMLDAIRALSGELDEDRVLARLVDAVTRAVGASAGNLVLLGPEGAVEGQGHGAAVGATAADGFPSLTLPVRARGTTLGSLSLVGSAIKPAFSAQDAEIASAIADAAGTVLDRARAHRLGERRRRWLEATAALTDALEPPLSLACALDAILTQVCGVSGAVSAAVLQRRSGESFVLAAHDPGERGRAGVAREIIDALDSAAVHLETHGVPTDDVEIGGPRCRTVIVPLRSHVAVDGALVVIHLDEVRGRDFDDRQLLCSFADLAGLALDRAQAIENRWSLETVSERDRVARDLHDVVMQRLFATGLRLQALQYAVSPDLAEPMDRIIDDLDMTIKDIRSTVFQL